MNKTQQHNVLVLVATDFEDIELITTIDFFARDKIDYKLVSVENLQQVKGKYNAIVKTIALKEVDLKQFTALFLPGGPGYKILLQNAQVLEIVRHFFTHKLLISAICAAPEVLVKAGIIKEQKITSFPGIANIANNTGSKIESEPLLVTGRDYEVSIEFAKEVIKRLKHLN